MTSFTSSLRNIGQRILQIMPTSAACKLRALRRAVLNKRSPQAVFTKIADDNAWDGTESVSGPGSTMEATALLRAALPELVEKYEIGSLLDIPCGDAYWISETLPKRVTYIGADIVPTLIARNVAEKSKLGRFETLDVVSSELPSCNLVMVRDCFIHLPNALVKKAISNIKRSGSNFLLSTTYPGRADNIDIEIGGFRPIDLQAPPFNLPEPLELILETEGLTNNKSVALWDISQLS